MRAITPSPRVLLVGHETAIRRGLRALLALRGYDVESATSGYGALAAFDRVPPDLIVLDLDLPDIKGIDVCRRIRAQSRLPIIVLSKRDSDADKIAALDDGADDYITKPFGEEELLARIRVALRRTFDTAHRESGQLRYGDLTLDFDLRSARRGTENVHLTPKEFELFAFFAEHPKRMLTHRMILTAIWGRRAANRPQHLWVLVNQLRKKLEPDPAHPRYFINEPWIGYCFVADPDERPPRS
jgi:two-component system KDP operon response regulator KdpE